MAAYVKRKLSIEGEAMKILTREREACGWSKAELGRQARLHPARVGQAENGRALLYDVEVERLASALGWVGDPAELLKDVDHEPA
jgi:ribosome-binding protein aMBF1 (putative translation factor)